MNQHSRPIASRMGVVALLIGVIRLSVTAAGGPGQAPGAPSASGQVTFSKDVAPIFQEHCQGCHRPGGGAPFSLVTYQDARPWVRAVKQRVVSREMPPWHIDKRVGIQKYKGDPSLSDTQIAVIARWVDLGAPEGNPVDMPAPKTFPPDDRWVIGTPDLVVFAPKEHVMYARGMDWWVESAVELSLTEDRWLKAIEVRPSDKRILHHVNLGVRPPKSPVPTVGGEAGVPQAVQERSVSGGNVEPSGGGLYSFEPNKQPRVFPENTGILIRAGSVLSLSAHYHAIGEEARDRLSVGLQFFPKGVVPKYKVVSATVMKRDEALEIPANSVVRHDAYVRLTKPTKVLGWSPHMHMRGKALTLEAILPNGSQQVLSHVDRYDFNWQNVYDFADDVAPLLPAGSMLHAIFIHDNTSGNRKNPDPSKWVGYGQSTYEEMAVAFVDSVPLEESDYARLLAERLQ